jgi:alpha-beta hydrolase superfamily lysophospholipase
MTSTETDIPLPFSRSLPASFRPIRAMLPLPDGYRTTLYVYRPPRNAKLREPVIYLHGIQSHPGWFCGSAAVLAQMGHPVFQVTRRGSGDNRTHRGHARSARQLLDDVACACHFAMRKAKAGRVRMVGVSWGGKLATAFCLTRREASDVASLSLVAPGIISDADVSGLTKLGVVVCSLLWPKKRFGIPLDNVKLFTDNQVMQHYLERDHYRIHRGTARLLFASWRLDRAIRRAKEGSLKIPTTLLLGARDRIIDNVHTRKEVIRLTAGRAHVEEINAAHVLEFEDSTRQFYGLLCSGVER